jgi:hypothetical protein
VAAGVLDLAPVDRRLVQTEPRERLVGRALHDVEETLIPVARPPAGQSLAEHHRRREDLSALTSPQQ